MRKKRIYLACPYSHPDRRVREFRFNIATQIAGLLIQEGHLVFSPITHSHPIAEVADLPKGWEYWKEFDESFLEWCHEVHIICLPGWETSNGWANEEIIAQTLRKPIIEIREFPNVRTKA
jgi:hypothetical protein